MCIYVLVLDHMILSTGVDYLMQNIDMIVFCAEGGVIVPEAVHHGATGDDDGCEECVNTVFKLRRLRTQNNHPSFHACV